VILDTNGLSAMAEGDEDIEAVLQQASEIAVPVIVLGEFGFGIRHSRNRVRYERWLSELLANCRLLVVDEQTAKTCGEIRAELKRDGRPIPTNNLWIAALTRQHAMSVVSRDQHFDCVRGLKRVSW